MARIDEYASIVGQSIVDDLRLLGLRLEGKIVQHHAGVHPRLRGK